MYPLATLRRDTRWGLLLYSKHYRAGDDRSGNRGSGLAVTSRTKLTVFIINHLLWHGCHGRASRDGCTACDVDAYSEVGFLPHLSSPPSGIEAARRIG